MVTEDLEVITRFLNSQPDLNVLNTRAFKKDDGALWIRVGSIKKALTEHDFEGRHFIVEHGEFSDILREMVCYLREALKYVANET